MQFKKILEVIIMLDIYKSDKSVIDYDAPNVLSIVVQGALFQGNMIETANHCRHWRDLFPNAEIILSLSVTDVVYGETHDGVFTSVRLVRKHEYDGHLKAALNVMLKSCNLIGMAGGATPLPPIKSDSPKLNNANLQIVAAKNGLSLATGQFVLRIRSDMIFMDRSFLDQYHFMEKYPRGGASVFAQRVLISWLFTLDPFENERLPLHLSDWFHFGLTSDVKRIWDVPFITLADSIFYRTHPHAEHSNDAERLFNIRLAVEQHIQYHCFKRNFPELNIAYHNDQSSTALAMDILIDNYVLCDLLRANCIFDKYAAEFFESSKRTHCIPLEKWIAFACRRNLGLDETSISRELESDSVSQQNNNIALLNFDGRLVPRRRVQNRSEIDEDGTGEYTALNLRTKHERMENGNISTTEDGILFHGPYIFLSRGSYVATVNVTMFKGRGSLRLRVTQDAGGKTLATRFVKVSDKSRQYPKISFNVASEGAADLELVCSVKGLDRISVSGIIIERSVKSEVTPPKWSCSKTFAWIQRVFPIGLLARVFPLGLSSPTK